MAGEDDGCELDPMGADDDQLSPVEKLEKFIDCEHSYSRSVSLTEQQNSHINVYSDSVSYTHLTLPTNREV